MKPSRHAGSVPEPDRAEQARRRVLALHRLAERDEALDVLGRRQHRVPGAVVLVADLVEGARVAARHEQAHELAGLVQRAVAAAVDHVVERVERVQRLAADRAEEREVRLDARAPAPVVPLLHVLVGGPHRRPAEVVREVAAGEAQQARPALDHVLAGRPGQPGGRHPGGEVAAEHAARVDRAQHPPGVDREARAGREGRGRAGGRGTRRARAPAAGGEGESERKGERRGEATGHAREHRRRGPCLRMGRTHHGGTRRDCEPLVRLGSQTTAGSSGVPVHLGPRFSQPFSVTTTVSSWRMPSSPGM